MSIHDDERSISILDILIAFKEVEIHHYVEYGRIMGHFKKAINYSFENNDQKKI